MRSQSCHIKNSFVKIRQGRIITSGITNSPRPLNGSSFVINTPPTISILPCIRIYVDSARVFEERSHRLSTWFAIWCRRFQHVTSAPTANRSWPFVHCRHWTDERFRAPDVHEPRPPTVSIIVCSSQLKQCEADLSRALLLGGGGENSRPFRKIVSSFECSLNCAASCAAGDKVSTVTERRAAQKPARFV